MHNPITRIYAAAAATLLLITGNPASAKQTTIDAVKPVKVAENIYVFDGPIANCVAFTGPEGVLLVDTAESMDMTKATDAALKTVCKEPVKYLVLTHKHFDHVNGNTLYASQGTKIVGQTSVRKAMLTEIPFFSDKPQPAAAAPSICFEDELTIHINDEDVWLYHPQTNSAHTLGDTVVYFKKANVIAVGDLFCNGMFMSLDTNDKGWLPGEVAALKDILSKIDDKTIVIPGHGEISDKRGLQHMSDVYEDISTKIETMIAQGKTLDEIKAARPTAPYDAELSSLTITFNGYALKATPDYFVECVYKSILSHKE